MTGLLQDVRYSTRSLISRPGFTATAVVVLALGIAANSTVFSWINSTLLDPIPGARAQGDLVSVMRGEWTQSPFPPLSYEDYRDLAGGTASFAGILGYHDLAVTVTGGGRPERILGTLASANYFEVLGITPLLGRGFLPEEGRLPGTAPVAVISYGLWQRQFGGDPAVLGRPIEINKRPYTIIGVTPEAFHGCKTGIGSDIWIPFTMDPLVTGWRRIHSRAICWLNVLGRLAPGADRRGAQAELNLRMQAIVAAHPDSHQGPNQITLDPLWRSPFGMGFALYRALSMLWSLAAVLLLLSCANVANLVLLRGFARRRELAIRVSLGASGPQIARQFLVESLLLGFAAGGAALVATFWTAGALSALIPRDAVPIVLPGRLDSGVLLAALAFSITSSVVVGVLPALRSSRLQPSGILKDEGGSVSASWQRSRLARALVVAQVSLSFVLLVCAGLFIRDYVDARQTSPGFDRDRVLLASFDLQSLDYTRARGIAFDRQLLARLAALPGVRSVSLANSVPLFGGGHSEEIAPEGYLPKPRESMEVGRVNAGPDYFRTMGIPILAGRDIGAGDGPESEKVVVVNESLARRYWAGKDPLGRRLRAYGAWFTVVGVARDASYRDLRREARPMIFVPLFQVYYHDPTIHLRVGGEPYAYVDPVKQAVRELSDELVLFDVFSLADIVEIDNASERLGGILVGILGLLALVLAAVGVYAVLAYATRQRTHEIGIRLALGAEPGRIRRLVLREGMALALGGLCFGVAGALAAGRALRSMLGVDPADLLTYGAVAVLLGLVALAACDIPARRASRLAPRVALREE